jgi:hypothetical protein
MRFDRSYPWVLRPVGAILATVAFTILSVSFLATWTDPIATDVGVWERVIAVSQTWYLAFVIWVCHLRKRKN